VIRIGVFSSLYADLTFLVLNRVLKTSSFEAVIINADESRNKSVDILIINNKPGFALPPAFFCEAAIVNTDDKTTLKLLKKFNTDIVTCGFNSKASVTASSILDEKVVFCVQRAFQTLDGQSVCQQEFSFDTFFLKSNHSENPTVVTSCLLPAITSALVAGISVEEITNL